MQFFGKKFVRGILVFFAFVGVLLILRESMLFAHFEPAALKAYVLSYGALAPFVYIAAYTLGTFFFVPGTILTVVGGSLFGPFYGTLYTVIGATMGAVCAFVATRFIGKSFATTGDGVFKKLRTYDTMMRAHGLGTVLFLRLVPLFPFNGLNFALGLTSISFQHYFWGTLIGIIPGTFVYVYFGNALGSLMIREVVIAVVLIVLLSVFGWYAKKYITRKFSS